MNFYSGMPGGSIGWDELSGLMARGEIHSIRILEPDTPESPLGHRAEAEVLVKGQGLIFKTLGSGSNLSSHTREELISRLINALASAPLRGYEQHLLAETRDKTLCGVPLEEGRRTNSTLSPSEFVRSPGTGGASGARCRRCWLNSIALGVLPFDAQL